MIRIKLQIILLFCVQLIIAQNKTDSTSLLKRQYITEVKVQSAINIHSFLEWPGAYSRIESKQLQQGNAYNIQEQLNKIPGVIMQQGTMSTNRITIRGIGSRTPYQTNRIKAYWGEMPLTDGDGATSIEDIGFNDISKMEIFKGSASSLYGAGMGGVILLHPFFADSIEDKIVIKSEVGSFQTNSHHAQLRIKKTDKGYFTWVGGAINSLGYRDNSKYKRYNSTFKGQQIIGRHYFNFLYNFRYLNGEIPSSLDSTDFINNPSKAAFTWSNIGGYEKDARHMLSLGLVSPVNNKWTNSITLFGKSSSLNELRPFNRLKESKYSYGLRDKLTYASVNIKAEFGTELMCETNEDSLFSVKENDQGQLLSSNIHKRYYWNVFCLLEYAPSNRLILQAALNVNQTGYRSYSKNHGDFEIDFNYNPVISPRIGVNYQIVKNTYLFASIGHGFSAPSVEETQMPDGSFNQDIKPEEGLNYELGARFNKPKSRLYADITFYLMKMKNLLVIQRDTEDQFYGKNAGATSHGGIETFLKYNLVESSKKKAMDISFSYFTSKNIFDDFVEDGINYKNNHLPGIPKSNFALELDGHFSKVHYNMNHQYQGKQYLNDANNKQYSSYHKTSTKLSYDVHLKKMKANLYIGADNIFDVHYASMVVINAKAFGKGLPRYYYPGLPFNIFGGVRFVIH